MGKFVFAEHGISDQVAKARPYVPFEQGDYETVYADYDRYLSARFAGRELTDEDVKAIRREKRNLKKIVKQSSGLLIARHSAGRTPLHGDWNPTVSAETRPDNPVKMRGPRWHYHPSRMPEEWPVYPTTGNRLHKRAVHQAEFMQAHIAKHHPDGNAEGVHAHQEVAKYVFLSGDEHAKRVDVHPMAFRRSALEATLTGRTPCRLVDVPRVYFGIEGCIKADAILTAILRAREDASVISVPSVTLWDTADLREMTKRWLSELVRGANNLPEIVIVPDADWFANRAVLTQALLCRARLRRWGYDACIAAPPVWRGLEPCKCKPIGVTENSATCKRCGGYFKGVDDFLAAGGLLEDLIVLHREGPTHEHLLDLQHMRTDKRVNCSKMLSALAEYADDEGVWEGSIEKLARISGFKRRTAFRVISDYLVGENIISVDRPVLLRRKRWVPGKGEVGAFDWEDRPKFQLPPHLRAEPFKFFRLKHWHDDEKEDMDKLLYELRSELHALRGDFESQQAAIDSLKSRLPANEVAEVVELFIADALGRAA